MDWQEEQRAQFLLAAFQQVREDARLIRARMHLNVQLSLTFYSAAIVFFLSNPDQSNRVRWLSVAGFLVLAAAVSWMLEVQSKTVAVIHDILVNLEKAMQFHECGIYLDPSPLYPASASTEKLQGFTKRGSLTRSYQFLVAGLAMFGVVVALVAR